jgi:septal ring-binding cell division protein DamX
MYAFKVYEASGWREAAQVTPKPKAPKPPKPVVPPTAAKPQSTVEKRNGSEALLGADWYRAQPKSHYTLQLLASNSRMNLRLFVRKHPQLDPVASFMMRRGGEPLYVLTTGSYPNREAALTAAERLSEGLKAWPRSLADVLSVMEQEPAEAQPAAATGEIQKKDTAWIWSRDPLHYTVQLAGAESEKAINEAMQRAGLGGEMSVVRTERNGKAWYVLIYGSYADREEAKRSIERLPAELQRTSPWPRSFASLQDELSGSPGGP